MVRYELLRDLPGVPAGTIATMSTGRRWTFYGDHCGFQFDLMELERAPDWFRQIPDEPPAPPLPKPPYPTFKIGGANDENRQLDIGYNRYSVAGVSLTFDSRKDCDRFWALIDALYYVFCNRRNVECGSVPFGGSVAYVDFQGGVKVGQMPNVLRECETRSWPTREMAEAEAAFQRLLFTGK